MAKWASKNVEQSFTSAGIFYIMLFIIYYVYSSYFIFNYRYYTAVYVPKVSYHFMYLSVGK